MPHPTLAAQNWTDGAEHRDKNQGRRNLGGAQSGPSCRRRRLRAGVLIRSGERCRGPKGRLLPLHAVKRRCGRLRPNSGRILEIGVLES